jgi:hypothetical protein
MPSKLLQRRSLLFVLSCLSIVLASCGGDDGTSPVEVDTRTSLLGGGGVPYSWHPMPSPTTETLWGVWGSPDEVIAVGNFGTAVHLGDEWVTKDTGTENDLCDVFVAADSRAFAVGLNGTVLHYDGSWASMTSGTTLGLADVYGFGDGTGVAVGQAGTILRYDGSAWSPMASVTDVNLFGVWGSAANDLYAVGVGGTIVHYDGAAWSFMTTATPENLSAVFGTSASDVWAVGDKGAIMHYDGATWGLFASGTTATLGDVWGSSPSDVWAVGSAGTIRHYDGSAWSTVGSGTEINLLGVWGRSECEVYAVGAGGTILRYAPTEVDGVQSFLCHDHPQGMLAPPTYGLRLDDLIGEGDYTFSFDYTDGVETARVLLTYDATLGQIHIGGRAYGGLLEGDAWSPTESGWIDIDFAYTTSVAVYDNCARESGDDLYVTAADALNTGTVTLDGWGGNASFSFIDRSDEDGCTFVFDNDWDSKGDDEIANDPAIWSAAGWLQPTTNGSRDWLFTATRYVTTSECAGSYRP